LRGLADSDKWLGMVDDKTKSLLSKRLAKRPQYNVTAEVREAIVYEFARGMEPADIAKKHGVSIATVYKWIKRAAQ
jgi:DNA-directed RNA polymerase specialized sigma24 family protein